MFQKYINFYNKKNLQLLLINPHSLKKCCILCVLMCVIRVFSFGKLHSLHDSDSHTCAKNQFILFHTFSLHYGLRDKIVLHVIVHVCCFLVHLLGYTCLHLFHSLLHTIFVMSLTHYLHTFAFTLVVCYNCLFMFFSVPFHNVTWLIFTIAFCFVFARCTLPPVLNCMLFLPWRFLVVLGFTYRINYSIISLSDLLSHPFAIDMRQTQFNRFDAQWSKDCF